MKLKDLQDELNEFNQPTNTHNPTDMAPPQRYNASTGVKTAMQSTTQRITRNDLVGLTKSKDLGQLMSQIDASFKLILMAADNTQVENFVIAQLNAVKQRIQQKVDTIKK